MMALNTRLFIECIYLYIGLVWCHVYVSLYLFLCELCISSLFFINEWVWMMQTAWGNDLITLWVIVLMHCIKKWYFNKQEYYTDHQCVNNVFSFLFFLHKWTHEHTVMTRNTLPVQYLMHLNTQNTAFDINYWCAPFLRVTFFHRKNKSRRWILA